MTATTTVGAHERDDTVRDILTAARHLFMAHGYRAVSTRRIAEACGLTQPALYHHFASKEALYVAMLHEEIGRFTASLAPIAAGDAPPLARLHAATRFLLLSDPTGFNQMMHDIAEELSEGAQREVREAFFGGMIAPVAAVVADAQRAGAVGTPDAGGMDATEIALVLLTLVTHVRDAEKEGFAPPQIAHAPDAAATRVVELLLHGVAPR